MPWLTVHGSCYDNAIIMSASLPSTISLIIVCNENLLCQVRARGGEWFSARLDMEMPGAVLLRDAGGAIYALETDGLVQIDLSDDYVLFMMFADGACRGRCFCIRQQQHCRLCTTIPSVFSACIAYSVIPMDIIQLRVLIETGSGCLSACCLAARSPALA